MSWESVIITTTSNISAIIAAIITAAASIIGIIMIQFLKVRQEIILRKKIELFDRKQKAYRDILKILSMNNDHSYFLGASVNWKIIRHGYDEIMLIGSKEVIEKINEVLNDNSPDSRGTDIKMKNLWNAIRKDLYGKKINIKHMQMLRASSETITILSMHNKYSDKLKLCGIDTPEKASDMDIDIVSRQTTIDRKELDLIKKTIKKELEYENELKLFFQDR